MIAFPAVEKSKVGNYAIHTSEIGVTCQIFLKQLSWWASINVHHNH